jgi:capsular polysaccharide transport system permease protein
LTATGVFIAQIQVDVGGTDGALPEIVGAYEELLVDIEFANTAYVQTLAALAAARAEARRQSRYLAPHIKPTLAQSALYPRRAMISGLTGLFLLLGWGMLMLIYYNVRDNR